MRERRSSRETIIERDNNRERPSSLPRDFEANSHHHPGTQGLIFVIDSADRNRIDEARQELHRIINDREMKDSLLLVFANKQDLKEAMSPQEVTEALQLSKLKDKVWYVVPSCATTGEGLLEGLAWLSNNVKAPPTPVKK